MTRRPCANRIGITPQICCRMTKMGAEKTEIETPAAALLAWYARHRRELPWRAPAGGRSLCGLALGNHAAADECHDGEALLRSLPRPLGDDRPAGGGAARRGDAAWAGLGYYARARNLHACAVAVVERHGGRFPQTEAELRPCRASVAYTAAAIAAIAFGLRAVVIDGNVERVVARLFAIGESMPAAKARIRAAAESLTPDEHCGDFAQAMMDLGATICTPRGRPARFVRSLGSAARARRRPPEAYPVKAPKPVRPSRSGAVFYIRRADGYVLVRTREARGLLGGMTEIPGTAWTGQSEPSGDDCGRRCRCACIACPAGRPCLHPFCAEPPRPYRRGAGRRRRPAGFSLRVAGGARCRGFAEPDAQGRRPCPRLRRGQPSSDGSGPDLARVPS